MMYSKPKGLYIKNRDRNNRQLSPRTSNESDENDAVDSERMSPRVQVQNYGEGNISSTYEPQWPSDFEADETQVKTPIDGHTSIDAFPEKAKRYVVSATSYKDLTRDKFITVPEPKTSTGGEKEVQARSSSSKSYSNEYPEGEPGFARAYSKPVARVTGYRGGVPAANFTKQQPHYATLRVHSRKDSNRVHSIKALPRDGTVRAVKNYHIGSYATLRPHNAKHLAKSIKHGGTVTEHSRGLSGFKRSTIMSERKDYCFSQFSIDIDQPISGFMPGDVISGRILLEAVKKVEIRFVELLIIGLASVHITKHDPNASKHSQEVIINKRSYVMGTPDGRWNSLITPGKYVSKFRFALPVNCPPSLKFENKESGFSFEIGYMVKARICDEFGSSSVRSNHSMNNLVKVLLSRRCPFLVQQQFDIHTVPRSMQPVTHSEFVNLGCIPIFVEPTAINLSLDRSVFLAGDDIRLKLIMPANMARKVKALACNLQMKLHTSLKTRHMFNVVQIQEHEPEGMIYQQDGKNYSLFEFILPTQSHYLSSFLQGCKLVHVGYSIVVTVKFRMLSGKLFLEYPIGLGPCDDPLNIGKTNAVPLFIRPKRFPHFSRETTKAPTIQNGVVHISEKPATQVNATKKSKGSQTLCCCVEDDDF